MIVKRERLYKKFFDNYTVVQARKRTSYWLLGIIPLYIKTEILSGDYH